MPAFCLLLLYSYYSNNFAGKINASLLGSSAGKAMDSWTLVLKVGGLIPSCGMFLA